MLNICAIGETVMPEDVVKYKYSIFSEGHFVMIVTNGTLTKRFKEFFISCKLESENTPKEPKIDVLTNQIYKVIYNAAIVARAILKFFNKDYKTNENKSKE